MNGNFDPFVSKAFSLLKYLHSKHGFSLVRPGLVHLNDPREYWALNKNDPHYQLIRVSGKKASSFQSEAQRIKLVIQYFGKDIGRIPAFLDIHVSDETYDQSFEEYDYMNIDSEFHNGVDVSGIYPDIYSSLKDKAEANTIRYAAKEAINYRKEKVKEFYELKSCGFTYGIIVLCFIIYLIEVLLARNYDDACAYIIMGADYKTFTLGLRQFYRLFTNAFLHGSFLHLISNMYSLFVVGHTLERFLGKAKYLFLLFTSILIASLTQGIMTENSLLLGMSGGIYGLFTFLLMELGRKGQLKIRVLLPTILLNLYLNFLSTTAWLAHIGGIIAGMIVFLIYSKSNKIIPIATLVIVITFMIYRYATLKTINPFYQATDLEVANIYYQWGLKDYSMKLVARLLDVYQKFGG